VINNNWKKITLAFGLLLGANSVFAEIIDICPSVPAKAAIHAKLREALIAAQEAENGGFGFEMWGTVVNRDGVVCAVAHSGDDRGDQWPGSRVISAQKANTANAFSLPGFALATANLFEATQNGGSLFGLQFSNPVSTDAAYGEPSSAIGTATDPMVGQKIGGINVFGGGLALYDANGVLVGAVGVSGDSSCADHNIAWRIRHTVGMDYVPNGVHSLGDDKSDDQILFESGVTGFGHASCGAGVEDVVASLPPVREVAP
jgi:uncharacterized protein GlcG (DUF336 family)